MYKLSVEDSGTHICFTVKGVLDAKSDAPIDAEIRRECEARGATLVLIDIREMTTRMSLIDNHESAKTFRQRMGTSIRAVAMVDQYTFRTNSEMYENTSVNRGATLKFFETKEQASRWLIQFSSTESHGSV